MRSGRTLARKSKKFKWKWEYAFVFVLGGIATYIIWNVIRDYNSDFGYEDEDGHGGGGQHKKKKGKKGKGGKGSRGGGGQQQSFYAQGEATIPSGARMPDEYVIVPDMVSSGSVRPQNPYSYMLGPYEGQSRHDAHNTLMSRRGRLAGGV